MHSDGLYTRFLPDEEATLKLGEEWSKQLSAPLTIYLEGGLGAGISTSTALPCPRNGKMLVWTNCLRPTASASSNGRNKAGNLHLRQTLPLH